MTCRSDWTAGVSVKCSVLSVNRRFTFVCCGGAACRYEKYRKKSIHVARESKFAASEASEGRRLQFLIVYFKNTVGFDCFCCFFSNSIFERIIFGFNPTYFYPPFFFYPTFFCTFFDGFFCI